MSDLTKRAEAAEAEVARLRAELAQARAELARADAEAKLRNASGVMTAARRALPVFRREYGGVEPATIVDLAGEVLAGEHVGAAGAQPEERPLGDYDARNVLWLSGRDLKQTNITSPAGKAAYARFEALPRVEGSFPRNGPDRIAALVALIRECHEIHSEWHDRLISRAEAEAYVRGEHITAAAGGAR